MKRGLYRSWVLAEPMRSAPVAAILSTVITTATHAIKADLGSTPTRFGLRSTALRTCLLWALQVTFAGGAGQLLAGATAHREIVMQTGETVGGIVERLAPEGSDTYRDALAAVMALNRDRFPSKQVSRVGPGFRLRVPLALLRNADGGDTPHGPNDRRIHITTQTQTLAELSEELFPDNAGAAENALIDLIRLNTASRSHAQSQGHRVVAKGTAMKLAPWMVTALYTPLPIGIDRAQLSDGIFVRAHAGADLAVNTSANGSDAPMTLKMGLAAVGYTALAASTAATSIDRDPRVARPTPTTAEPTVASADETVLAQVSTLDRAQAEEARLKKMMEGKPKAYEDKVMDTSTLPAQRDDGTEAAPQDATGFRSYFAESRVGFADGGNGARASEYGLRGEYRHETLNHGEFVAQADLRTRSGDSGASIGLLTAANDKTSARITLRNLGFPITTQLFADTTVGDQLAQVTDAFGRAYRLSLGSGTVRGASTHVFSRELDVRVGIGERGALAGGPYPGFERTGGMLAWLGATQRFGTNSFVGAQVAHASGMHSFDSLAAVGAATKFSASSAALAVGYGTDLVDPGSSKARLTLVASNRSDGMARNGVGAFAEGGARLGGYRHEFGAYWSQPRLMFGDAGLASDNRGAYWRVDRNAGRLFWGMGLDFEETNPSHAADRLAQRRFGGNGNVQYRLDRDSSVGGSAQVSDTKYLNGNVYPVNGDGTRSFNASAFYQTRFIEWGRSRVTATVRRNQILVTNDVAATGQELQWEHDWITGKYETMRPEFVTTLGYARDTSSGQVQTYPTAGVQWRYWIDADWNFGGNLRYTSRTGNLATSRGLSGGVTGEKIFNNGWRVGVQASINEARVDTTGPLVTTSRSSNKSVFLYVRWEGSRGEPYASLGLKTPGSAGSGAITGIVYFDANRDGSQQADERGVPNVEVVLDGRYRVTTDRDGRFEFPLVPTGQHRITLVLESVPLPWGAALERGLGVDVPLRGQATANIPVVKVGE